MTDRETRSSVAFRWVTLSAGIGAFYVEMIWFAARPIVIGGALTMMGYPIASWIDGLRRREKGKDE